MTTEREPYTIEPPVERQREMSRDRKLDTIIDMLRHHDDEPEGGDGDAPEVTFEPEASQLPTTPGDEEPEGEEGEGEGAGTGEGEANVATEIDERRFRHPSAKRRALIER